MLCLQAEDSPLEMHLLLEFVLKEDCLRREVIPCWLQHFDADYIEETLLPKLRDRKSSVSTLLSLLARQVDNSRGPNACSTPSRGETRALSSTALESPRDVASLKSNAEASAAVSKPNTEPPKRHTTAVSSLKERGNKALVNRRASMPQYLFGRTSSAKSGAARRATAASPAAAVTAAAVTAAAASPATIATAAATDLQYENQEPSPKAHEATDSSASSTASNHGTVFSSPCDTERETSARFADFPAAEEEAGPSAGAEETEEALEPLATPQRRQADTLGAAANRQTRGLTGEGKAVVVDEPRGKGFSLSQQLCLYMCLPMRQERQHPSFAV